MKTPFLIPLGVVVALFVVLGVGLTLNPHEVPSPFIGKPAPPLVAVDLDGAVIQLEDHFGEPFVVNYWASWCTPCLAEHPLFMELAAHEGISIIGVNYKDEHAAALRWLRRHGDPYQKVAVDPQGRNGLEWGVYGVPETFLVDADGRILYKHVGPLSRDDWARHFAPTFEAAQVRR
jgi:cytochrome c biogenesis protein CcmG/thiol:disulfide interchange protein DsbE